MRYSLEPSYRKYVRGQGFMSFAKNMSNKYGRKLLDKSIDVVKNMSNKYGRKILDKSIGVSKDFAKTACKKLLKKSAEATGEMIGNGTIEVNANNPSDRQNRPLILKNNAPFISCITKINNELIEDTEDLDIVMPMYNLLEYSKNYKNYTIILQLL